MPVLNWIGKDKVVNHDKELPFRVLKPVKELSVDGNSGNLLIEGDNLEALKALMPFYYNKVKCIYIDPPYNTGNEGWVYNDKVNAPQIKAWLNKVVGAEGEDLCRHDKWLCMMYPRLKLLKDLLSDSGVIFVSIDDNELHNLRQLMDEIFGEQNFLGTIIWKKKTNGNNMGLIPPVHDYVLVYAKYIESCYINELNLDELYLARKYSNPDNDPRGPWTTTDLSANHVGPYFSITNPQTGEVYFPPEGRYWVFSEEEVQKRINDGRIIFGKNGKGRPVQKKFKSEMNLTQKAETIWDNVALNSDATNELSQILSRKIFETPKPSKLIKQIIKIGADKDSIILDSFVGSGTTGQAVLELNKEDGGKRKFILVELERDIAKKVTAERLKKVIKGYGGAKFPEGTGGGFEYLELNGMLYDYSGYVNPNAQYEDMAAYIFFTETRNYLDLSTIKNPYIGSQASTHYFLFFKGKDNNVLDEKTLKETEEFNGNKVIYADKCLLDEEYLGRLGITFKQIPYELKKY